MARTKGFTERMPSSNMVLGMPEHSHFQPHQHRQLPHHSVPPCHLQAPIHPASDWNPTDMEATSELDDWLQGTFQETTIADHVSYPPSHSETPTAEAMMALKELDQEKRLMVLSKIEERIALLQALKSKLIDCNGPTMAVPEPTTNDTPCFPPEHVTIASMAVDSAPRQEEATRCVSLSSSSTSSSRVSRKRAAQEDDAEDSDCESEESGEAVPDQVLTRREQNRVSAKKSRARKKQKMDGLQKFLDGIRLENKKLWVFVESKLGKTNARTLVTQRTKVIRKRDATKSTKRFIEAMRNPGNRVVTGDALEYLRKLSANVVSATK
jgi:hypothetical protein